MRGNLYFLASAALLVGSLAVAQSLGQTIGPGSFGANGHKVNEAIGPGNVETIGPGGLPINVPSSGSVPVVPYTGPGDVVAGATAWWGLRCYNTAYNGNMADVYAPADASHTLLTCSSGGVINETLQALATTCAVSCTVKTYYDQSGGTNCTGAACNLVQANAALRDTFTLNCQGTLPCGVRGNTTSYATATVYNGAAGQPFVVSFVGKRTAAGAANCIAFDPSGFGIQFGYGAAADIIYTYAGVVVNHAAVDNALHAVQWTAQGATSVFYIDGVSNAEVNGADTMAGFAITAPDPTGCAALTADFFELGAWGGVAFTGPQNSSMNSNQHTYWGF